MGISSSKFSKSRKSKQPSSAQPINMNFQFSDGRRFHNVSESSYPLPNDDEECDRLHMQHFYWRYVWQSNFSAPVNDILYQSGATVLDVGCGAASWIFEMATNYPNAQFTGVDISPVQPSQIKPNNINFVQANLLDGLPFEDDSFDFVFQRFLLAGIPKDKWLSSIKELTRVLKPGGFLELMEVEFFTHNLGPNTKKLNDNVIDFMERNHLDPLASYKLKQYAEEQVQLENIHEEEKSAYFGTEAGKLGQVHLNNYNLGFQGMKISFLKTLNISSEEFDKLLEEALKECKELNVGNRSVRVYARKT